MESSHSIHDRTPSLFLADLLQLYSAIMPTLVEKKKHEAERPMPVRKRTALVDQRLSRTQVGQLGEEGAKGVREQQYASPHKLPPFSASALGLGAPVSEAPPSASVPTATQSVQTSNPPEVSGRPQFAQPKDDDANGPPHFVEPIDTGDDRPPHFVDPEDDEDTPTRSRFHVVPATPEIPQEDGRGTDGSNTPTPADDSATASILQGMEGNDETAMSGAAGLKRAGSGEATRLRGPRGESSEACNPAKTNGAGARGPRPAPARVSSHSRGTSSVSQAVAQFENSNAGH